MIAPVVTWDWVEEHRRSAVVADVRWYLDGRSGREAYDRGHIPGAVFVDLERSLSGDPNAGRGRHPLPSPEDFAAAMSSLGVTNGSVVVGYDDQGGVIAARLVWMLRARGHEAALLDGGLDACREPLVTDRQDPVMTTFEVRPWPREALAAIEDVLSPANVVVDARSAERYHGRGETLDPRAGHIPGAVSLHCRENLSPSGYFLPPEVLRQRFEQAGVHQGVPVVSYCGSGVTACHNLLALELCGLGKGRLYPGSWSEYSLHADLPAEI